MHDHAAFDFCAFWRQLTGEYAHNMEGEESSYIHNPAIRYVQKFLAHAIFDRGDSVGNTTLKELYLIFCILNMEPSTLLLSCSCIWIK